MSSARIALPHHKPSAPSKSPHPPTAPRPCSCHCPHWRLDRSGACALSQPRHPRATVFNPQPSTLSPQPSTLSPQASSLKSTPGTPRSCTRAWSRSPRRTQPRRAATPCPRWPRRGPGSAWRWTATRSSRRTPRPAAPSRISREGRSSAPRRAALWGWGRTQGRQDNQALPRVPRSKAGGAAPRGATEWIWCTVRCRC